MYQQSNEQLSPVIVRMLEDKSAKDVTIRKLLADLLQTGDCMKQDIPRAMKLYAQLLDNSNAQHVLGLYCELETNDEKGAVAAYKRAAKMGVSCAAYRLALIYRDGRGVEKNQKLAIKWLKQAEGAGM